MVIELCVVRFCSEIILLISNRISAVHLSGFKIMHMISDQIALHSVQLPLLIKFCHHPQIDFLVNNAGLAQIGSSVDSSLDVDQALMKINVLGAISLTKVVLPYMVGNNSGQIVVTSSASGKCGEFKVLNPNIYIQILPTDLYTFPY